MEESARIMCSLPPFVTGPDQEAEPALAKPAIGLVVLDNTIDRTQSQPDCGYAVG